MSPTDPKTSAWVSANAGSGKTQLLATRVTRLLLSGAPPDRILCLTFTKAAAAEMSARLFRDLSKWPLLPDVELVKALEAMGADEIGPADLSRARRLFAQALETPGGLKIQTIHSFCQLLLSRFPVEAGVPPRFQVLDERSADELMRQARNAILLRADTDPRLSDAVAVVAARADDVRFGELLDFGTYTGRGNIADLVARHGGEDEFLAHLRAELKAPVEDDGTLVTRFCETLGGDHAMCKRAMDWLLTSPTQSDTKAAEAIARFLSCAELGERFSHLRGVLLKKEGGLRASIVTKKFAPSNPELSAYLISLAERFEAHEEQLRAARVMRATGAIVILATAVMEEYVRLKRLRAALDYDDLILKTRDLSLRSHMAQWVLYKLDGGIDHILVDEAQDTSHDQWTIVRQLAGEFFAGKGARDHNRTLFAVGDEKQSIFGFQGAAPAEFGRNRTHFLGLARQAGMPFEDAYPAVSRRSGKTILKFVDSVFAQPIANKGLTFAGEKVLHEADRNAEGRVEVWPTVPVPDDIEVDPWAPVDSQPTRGSHATLAKEIAGRIRAWIDGGARIPSMDKAVTPGSIMILVRRRNAFATEMIRQLLDRRIPVAGADRMVLTEQMAIQDLVALGRFALLPEDDLNLAALMKSPFLDLTEDDLFELAYEREKKNLWSVLTARKDERPALLHAHAFLSSALAAADFVPPYEFYARILGSGVRRKIVARLGDEAADAIDEFLALALAHEGTHAPSLERFLDWFEKGASDVKRDMERANDAVRVMTVHGAKGLEAEIVIVPDTTQIPEQEKRAALLYTKDSVFFNVKQSLEVQAITDAKRMLGEREMEEYRRLLYVALTRARNWLVVAGYEMKKTPIHEESWYRAVADAAEQLGGQPGDDGVIVFGDAIEAGAVEQRPTNERVVLPPFLHVAAPKEATRPRFLRPSDATGEEEPALLSPLADTGKRFRRGLLIHALLAALPNTRTEARRAAALRYLEREGISGLEAAELADETFAILDHPQFAPLFAEGSRAEVPIVAALPELGIGARISGQIDRLAVTADAILIADYKTNRPPPKTVDDTPGVYRAQMALYRAALAKIYPAKRISCALIWTDGARLMPLPNEMLDAELGKITQRMQLKALP